MRGHDGEKEDLTRSEAMPALGPDVIRVQASQLGHLQELLAGMIRSQRLGPSALGRLLPAFEQRLERQLRLEARLLRPEAEDLKPELALELVERQRLLRHLLSDLRHAPLGSPLGGARLRLLQEGLGRYAKALEQGLWPLLLKGLSDEQRGELGAEMERSLKRVASMRVGYN